jgi:predicted enzyme related to lactoylglutathione lyase
MKTPAPKAKKKEVYKNFINWFEIPATHFERAVDFYQNIYNITFETHQVDGYQMAYFPAEEGVGGAIICGEGSIPADKGPLLYLNGGDDLDQILNRVPKAGGRILMQKQIISEEAGCFALFIDTEGNKMALHSKA